MALMYILRINLGGWYPYKFKIRSRALVTPLTHVTSAFSGTSPLQHHQTKHTHTRRLPQTHARVVVSKTPPHHPLLNHNDTVAHPNIHTHNVLPRPPPHLHGPLKANLAAPPPKLNCRRPIRSDRAARATHRHTSHHHRPGSCSASARQGEQHGQRRHAGRGVCGV